MQHPNPQPYKISKKPLVGLFFAFLIAFFAPAKAFGQCGGIDFTVSPTKGCVPLLVRANASGVPSGAVIYWNFGKGFAQGPPNTLQDFTEPGTYSVSMQVRFQDGTVCQVDKPNVLDFTTVGDPNFDYVLKNPTQCTLPAEVELRDYTQGVADRKWIINGVEHPQKDAVITHEFNQAGKHDVTLYVYSENGCEKVLVKDDYIDIGAPLTASFCATQFIEPDGRVRLVVRSVEDSSSSDIVSRQWSFPGGSPSSFSGKHPPVVTYPNVSPRRDVTYTIANSEGCTYSFVQKAYVQPWFQVNNTTNCTKDSIRITITDNEPDRGTYTVGTSAPSTVVKKSEKVFVVKFRNPDTSDLIITAQRPGATCSDTFRFVRRLISLPPSALFRVDSPYNCSPPDTVFLVALDSMPSMGTNTYRWYILDSLGNNVPGSPVNAGSNHRTAFILNRFGIYDVRLEVSNSLGCVDVSEQPGAIRIASPVADFDFSKNPICLGEPTGIINRTRPREKPENPYTYLWRARHADSAGILVTAHGRTPNIPFTVPGRYYVNLMVKNSERCYDSAVTKTIEVIGALLEIVNEQTFVCLPGTTALQGILRAKHPNTPEHDVRFTWTATPSSGVVFSNVNSLTTQVSFTQNGCYSCSLSAISNLGCTTTVSKSDLICVGTQADFVVDTLVCRNDTVRITNTSGNNATQWKWSVSPSENVFLSSDTAKDPAIVLGNEGCYTVRLVSTRNNDPACEDVMEKRVCVRTPSVSFHSPDSSKRCAPVLARFIATGENATKYLWIFGDGQTTETTEPEVLHTYERNSVNGFTVRLVAYNAIGCPDTFTRPNYIKVYGPEPEFSVVSNTGCGEVLAVFQNTSRNVKVSFVDYGDGSSIDSGSFKTRLYRFRDWTIDSNVFVPRLFALDDSACLSSWTDTVIVYRQPEAKFFAPSYRGCAPWSFQLIDSSKYADEYYWDFNNDGVIDDITPNPTVVFTEPGTYSIRLRVRTRKGCESVYLLRDSFIVYAPPKADFGTSSPRYCHYQEAQFIDFSTGETGVPPEQWHWKFYDGDEVDSSSLRNPAYRFKNPGWHKVMLAIVNARGCVDTLVRDSAVFTFDSIPPDALRINSVDVGPGGDINISWNKAPEMDFDEYLLYRKEGNGFQLLRRFTRINDTFYIDQQPGVNADAVSYSYVVVLKDYCDLRSDSSIEHNSIRLTLESDNAKLTNFLSWTSYSAWSKGDTAGVSYEVYRKDGIGPFKLIAITGDTWYTDSNLCDYIYQYYVRAVTDTTDYYARSNRVEINFDYIYQDKPILIHYVTVTEDEKIYMAWEPGIQPNLRRYIISRYEPERLSWDDIYAATTDTFFLDEDVEPNQFVYRYRIRTEDMCGRFSRVPFYSNNIRLRSAVVNDERLLHWNFYRYWAEGVLVYNLQVQTSHNGPWRDVASIAPGDTAFLDRHNYNHINDSMTCYRLIAYENTPGGDTSVSNITCPRLPSRIFIPNAFTPNNDPYNQHFKPEGLSLFFNETNPDLRYEFRIYNRWGAMIFETFNKNDGWDGNFNGRQAPEGVYFYRISAHGLDGVHYFKDGNFHLLR